MISMVRSIAYMRVDHEGARRIPMEGACVTTQ